MKKISAIIIFVAFFCNCFGQYISQTTAKLAYSQDFAISQSFIWPGGTISEISVAAFSRYQPTDHPSKIYLIQGVNNNISGNILFQQNFLLKSLNKFYSENFLSTLSISQIESLWNALQDSVDMGILKFEDLKTDFQINQTLPPGVFTLFFELDSMTNYLGYKTLTIFGSCIQVLCPFLDLYPDGEIYAGYSMIPYSLFSEGDMAFEIYGVGLDISENLNLEGIVIYPNPSSGEFSLSFNDTQIEYEIFNQLGVLIQRGITEKRISYLNQKGIFLIRIKGLGLSKKIVVH